MSITHNSRQSLSKHEQKFSWLTFVSMPKINLIIKHLKNKNKIFNFPSKLYKKNPLENYKFSALKKNIENHFKEFNLLMLGLELNFWFNNNFFLLVIHIFESVYGLYIVIKNVVTKNSLIFPIGILWRIDNFFTIFF